ncbi:MAG: hypothetical protein AAFR31_01520 [Cyanobacteria bacterium J06627_8]
MTIPQLKQYLSKHRQDDAKFTAALNELMNRDTEPVIYSAEMPIEEMEHIIQRKIQSVSDNR